MQLQRYASGFKEIVPACLLAGTGMIFAGTYVDWIKHLYLSNLDPCLLAIIPPLIGLKGNLEVTLSSRLSTMANIKAQVSGQFLHLFLTTLVFILIKAVAAGSLISILGVLLFPNFPSLSETLSAMFNLIVISVLTSMLCVCALSFLVFGLVICCLLLGVNADNVAPPLAAAFGDLATVTLLICVNGRYASSPHATVVLTLAMLVALFLFGPWYLTRRLNSAMDGSLATNLHSLSITMNTFASSVAPLFCAIVLSSLSGQVLAHFAQVVPNLARLQIAINGVGGCFGSIVVSRMLTRLHAHQKTKINDSPPSDRKLAPTSIDHGTVCCPTPREDESSGASIGVGQTTRSRQGLCHRLTQQHQATVVEMTEDADRVIGRILVACVPVHSLLALTSFLLQWIGVMQPSDQMGRHIARNTFQIGTLFAYLCASFAQVVVVLQFAKWIVFTAWSRILTSNFGDSFVLLPCDTGLCEETKGDKTVHSTVGADDDGHDGQRAPYQSSLASLDLTAIALTTGLGDLLGSVFLVSALYFFQA